jgi:hypothetical protein
MNTNTAAIPVSQNESVIKIISFLRDNGMTKETQEMESIMSGFDFMETQFGKLFEELQGVKSQLKAIEDRSLRGTVSRIAETADLKITEVKAQFNETKNSFTKACSEGLNFIKDKGAAAFSKAMEFMRVKSALTNLKDKLKNTVKFINQSVYRLESVKMELHEVDVHKHQAKRVFFGKETKPMPEYDDKRGLIAKIQKLLIKVSEGLKGFEKVTDTAIEGLVKLEQRREREKVSVKSEIREIKNAKTSGDMPSVGKTEREAR